MGLPDLQLLGCLLVDNLLLLLLLHGCKHGLEHCVGVGLCRAGRGLAGRAREWLRLWRRGRCRLERGTTDLRRLRCRLKRMPI